MIERKTSKEFRTEMTMNGVKREASDKLKDSKDPTIVSQVDAIAIGYPNGRHYDYIELAAA